MQRGGGRTLLAATIAVAMTAAACGASTEPIAPVAADTATTQVTPASTTPPFTRNEPTAVTSAPDTTAADTSTTIAPTTSTTLAPTTTTAPPTTAATETIVPAAEVDTAGTPAGDPVDNPVINAAMPLSNAAFDVLARNNAAASITVMRDGEVIVSRASGTTIDGSPATHESPMLVASVSKIVTAYAIARLAQQGLLAVDDVVPWAFMGLTPNDRWGDVTIRELLDHTSGMPVARQSWFTGGTDCRGFLPSLVSSAPQGHRGAWRYSNGNYCALGLLIEFVTGQPLDTAIRQLVFEPLGRDGPHLSTNGLLPTDVPHANNVGRLSRLGAAGTFAISTADLTAMAAATTFDDLDTLLAPGIFIDQYGWGHTGTVLGAVSCFWVFELGRTVVAATISGNSPAKGGDICDRIVPAIADDLGIGQGRPNRTP